MEILYAGIYNQKFSLDIDKIEQETGSKINNIYYKLALFLELNKRSSTVILEQKLENDIQIEELVEIFKLAKRNSIVIINEKYRDTDFLKQLLENKIFNGVFEDDVDTNYIINLIKTVRNYEEAKEYYCVLSEIIVNDDDKLKEKNKDIPKKISCKDTFKRLIKSIKNNTNLFTIK